MWSDSRGAWKRFLTIFLTFEWIFLQNILKNLKLNKTFICKVIRAEREKNFLTIFWNFWVTLKKCLSNFFVQFWICRLGMNLSTGKFIPSVWGGVRHTPLPQSEGPFDYITFIIASKSRQLKSNRFLRIELFIQSYWNVSLSLASNWITI